MNVLKNKKIIFLTPSLKAGGGNRVFVEIANCISKSYSEISIYYPNNSKEKSHYNLDKNVKLVAIGSVATGKLKKILNVFLVLRELMKILDNDTETICIISDPIISIFYSILLYKHKKRTYRFIQADDYRIFDDLYVLKNKIILFCYKKLCLKSYTLLDNYMFNSQYTYSQFKDLMPQSNIALNLVHPGIDTNVFFDKSIANSEMLNIALVARKHPMKGFIDFLSAWDRLDQNIKDLISNIFIISHDELSDFNLPVKAKVIKPKSDIEISEVMNSTQIFISTSWWEGFGLPPLEAMACGCAVISSNSKGLLEYAVDGQNCLIYEPRNIPHLADSLTKLILDNVLRNQLSSAAAIDAKKFTWENTANQFANILTAKDGLIY